MERLHILDGFGYIFRAYFGMASVGGSRRLSNAEGLPTGALYVYASMLLRLREEERPDRVVVVFDAPGKNFRDEMDPNYKKTRKETGSWNTSGAKWEHTSTLSITAGKHTLKLLRDGAFPHVVCLKFESSVSLPKDWRLRRPSARTLDSPPPVPAYTRYTTDNVDIAALRRAIVDLMETFGGEYPRGGEYLKRLDVLEGGAEQFADASAEVLKQRAAALVALRRQALLDSPLVNFDKLLLVKRAANAPSLGLPRNWQSNSSLPKTGYDDQIAVHSLSRADTELTTLFKPSAGRFVGDVDLHFDADRMLFSMLGDQGRWQVFEIGIDGSGLRQLTGEQPDVDSYDACYLPSGKIIFTSTACFAGVPCVYGSSHVANLYVMDGNGRHPSTLLRSRTRLVPHRDERWPRLVYAVGVYRHATLEHAVTVPDEPGRH